MLLYSTVLPVLNWRQSALDYSEIGKRMDISSLKQEALEALFTILDSIRPSSKILILDRSLTTIVNVVLPNSSSLKDHGVERIYWLQGGENKIDPADRRRKSVVYLTSTAIEQSFLVAQHVESILGTAVSAEDGQLVEGSGPAASATLSPSREAKGVHKPSTTSLHIICVPDKTLAFSLVLEEARVLGDVNIHSWPVHFLPIDEDILSLNLQSAGFEETYLDGIPSAIHRSAQAIQSLQERYGLIGRITGKGDAARILADILLDKRLDKRTELAQDAATINRNNGTSGNFLGSIKVGSGTVGSGNSNGHNGNGTNGTDFSNSQFTADGIAGTVFSHKFSNIFVGTHIDHLVIIDRKTDLVTPLLTQLTYHGLVDEFYKLSETGQVDLPTNIVQGPSQKQDQHSQDEGSNQASSSLPAAHLSATGTKRASLYSEHDTLFNTIKDINFALVGNSLNKVARQLQADYETRHDANTVSEIKQFVSKVGGLQHLHQSLRFHTALAENLMSKVQDEEFNKWLEVQQNIVAESLDTNTLLLMIEDLINRSSSLSMVLRLLSLECLCKGGIKEKQLIALKHQIVQTYGYKHILTLSKLEKLGLVFARSPSIPNNFPTLRKSLNLIVDQVDDSPNDVSTAYSGYAPLSVRLVQCVIDKRAVIKPRRLLPNVTTATNYANAYASTLSTGWKGAEDIISHVPGNLVEDVQRSESQLREAKVRKILTRNTPGHDKPTTLVFYLGGITYGEIADLRLVAAKDTVNTNIIIATTGIISGSKIIDVAQF
ncbi:tethering complex ATP-binding subunit VPS33 [Sugiyamaella lignohabitans]|uniref:Tethering complex ATP-binding subunit VPS33 n=1 Tax=Sugiyamaella lignohabitans TaxID=796027 RepID=A0A167DM43_9ASCO|nr:tethering complex ATP-binding subunit VPS33 [Sugiyamaella lignohabitans]ANB13060.1 tethering complex ATP-binding subunit VPS33 [Sugiyamaella lignohabitans]